MPPTNHSSKTSAIRFGRPELPERSAVQGGEGVPVLFRCGPRAVAVFKIETVVFDRLALELVEDALANRLREPGVRGRQVENLRERPGGRRKGI